MTDKIRDIFIKIVLTIPALLVGIFAATIYLFKPTYELWFGKSDFEKAVEVALDK